MKLFVPALALSLIAGSAHAALHPKYYEEGRRTAPNVIVVRVLRVEPPPRSLGDCQVHGKVRGVERGALYKVGQAVTIAVPCVATGGETPSGGILYQPLREVRDARHARAFLSDTGQLVMSQYDLLP